MGLRKILETWRDYPTRLYDREIEKPDTAMPNGLLTGGLIFAEAVVAGLVTYYTTKNKIASAVASGAVMLGRLTQSGIYVYKKAERPIKDN